MGKLGATAQTATVVMADIAASGTGDDVVNGPENLIDWDAINWHQQSVQVQRLRQRIFKATQAARRLPAHAGCLSRVPRRVASTVLRGPRRSNAPGLPDTVFSDLIDGPIAHMPSGRFAANGAWAICAIITHNLLRAAGTLAGPTPAVARGATLRRHLITVPARLARPQHHRVMHLPAHWPWATAWTDLWHAALGPPATA